MDLGMKAGEGDNGGVDELLQAQALVFNHTLRFTSSFAVRYAVQLEIPDIIHKYGRPMTISELASTLSIHPTKHLALHRLMRLLVQSGFFAEQKISDERKGYVLTPASELLLMDNPFSLRTFAIFDSFFTKPYDYVGVWLRNDDPAPINTAYGNGKDHWKHMADEPMLNQMFNQAMASDGLLTANVVISKCKGVFEGLKSLVDVGGGMGVFTKALAKEFLDMEFIVFDLPHVVDGLQGSENVKFVGGNMFDHIPPANAIMLKWIMHDWSHEDCVKILKKCKEAIVESKDKEGKIIIIDIVMGSEEEDNLLTETQLFFDLHMMVNHKSQERNEEEWSKIFLDVGFSDYKINHILGVRSLIELFP